MYVRMYVCMSVCPAMHSEMPERILTKLCVVGPVVTGPCTMPLIFFVHGCHMFLNAVTLQR